MCYIDEESSLTYLQFCGEHKEQFETKMVEINMFYANLSPRDSAKDTEYFLKNINELNTKICCAKYTLDDVWYRVKILRKWQADTVILLAIIKLYSHLLTIINFQ